jgi:glycosyltransferase involved in cell wall biosynthesis
MRILTGIDVPFQPFGGSLVVCDDWYSNLPEDVEVRFLTLPNPTDQHWWHIKDVVFMDIEKTRTQEGFMDYVKRLRDIVQEQIADFKPDIIHSQHLNYGLARAFADMQLDIPRIGICHGTDVQAALHSDFFLDNLTHICDNMDLLLFSAPIMRDDFTKLYPTQKASQICPAGIPESYFNVSDRKIRFDGHGTLKVLYAGRLLDWKGPDIAVDALAHVQNDIHLTIIGNEDQKGYKQRMLDSVQAHNLSSKVNFKPQLTREQLMKEFSNYDVIVFPSRQLEAFSLTVVEAQANGLPVIYHPGGGIANTVGTSGIKMSDASPEALATVLDTVYAHPEILAATQAKGYENAKQYTLGASRTKLFDISKRLITQYRADRTL